MVLYQTIKKSLSIAKKSLKNLIKNLYINLNSFMISALHRGGSSLRRHMAKNKPAFNFIYSVYIHKEN